MICGLIAILIIQKRGERTLYKMSKKCVTNQNVAVNAALNISLTDNESYGVHKATDNTKSDPEVGVAVVENESYGVSKAIDNSNACYGGTTEDQEDNIYVHVT